MVKKMLIGMVVMLLTFSFSGLSWASIVLGKVVKIDGNVLVVKDDLAGKDRQLHIDQTTIKQGEVKVGAQVQVDVDDKTDHAKSITVKEM
jgi:hypothetical protein